MKNGKYQRKGEARRGANKALVVLLALVLVLGCAIGGTIAWLTDTTEEVQNTFTVGNIDINLTESDNLDLKMVPGNTITKDPKVTVTANSEACWLFVKIEKSENLDEFITYAPADGWIPLPDVGGVYYREVNAVTAKAGVTYSVLAGDQVTVNDTVTKDMMDAFDTDNNGTLSDTEKASLPTLTFTAYAIQSANLKDASGNAATTAAQAWALVSQP